MNEDHLKEWIENNASYTHSRSSGPGGQNVNKVNTKVTLHIPISSLPLPDSDIQRIEQMLAGRINSDNELVVSSGESRSQHRNRELAVIRAAALIAGSLKRPKKRKKTRPTRASVEKRLSDKKRRSEIKRNRQGSD